MFEDDKVSGRLKCPKFDDDVKMPQGTLTSVIPLDSTTLGDHVSI